MSKTHKLDRNNWFDYLNMAFMVLFAITILFPYWDLVIRSVSSPLTATSLNIMLWPKEFTMEAYRYIAKDDAMVRAFLVTVARTLSGTALSLILLFMAAYPLSNKELPGRGYITTFFLIPMFFGGGLIPSYIINKTIGLTDNFLVYILPGAVGIYNVILMRNYIMSLDKGLEESAFIDGANYPTILLRIIVPLSKPIAATIALWVAVGQWNAWMDCLIYIRDEDLVVMQMILRRMMTTLGQNSEQQMLMELVEKRSSQMSSTTLQMATTVVTIVPIICVYPFIQKYFVKGIMVGSLKG